MTVYVRPQRADVRTAVAAAAAELFLTQGYRATTLDAIATAAGFTKGAIYSNFGGKPQLFAAAVSETFARRSGAAVQAAAALGTDRAEIARQLTHVVATDAWSTVMGEFRAVAREDASVAAIYAELRQGYRDRLVDQLRELRTPLGLPADYDFEAASLLLIMVISGLAEERATVAGMIPDHTVTMIMTRLIEGLLP